MERPQIHSLEDLSRSSFSHLCARAGWVVVDLSPDYGEDAIVFVYEDMQATGDIFFVQLKATSTSKTAPGSGLVVSLKTKTLRRWQRFRLPVVLVLYNAESEKLYWLEVAQHLACKAIDPSAISTKSKRLRIPFRNELTLASLECVKEAVCAITPSGSHSLLRPFGVALRDVNRAVSEVEKWSISVVDREEAFRRGTGIIEPPLGGISPPSIHPLVLKSTHTFGGCVNYEVRPLSCHDPNYRANLDVLHRQLSHLDQKALVAGIESLPAHVRNLRTACVVVARHLSPGNATTIISVVMNLVDILASIQMVAADLPNKRTSEYLDVASQLRESTAHFKRELERLQWAALDIVVE